MVNARRLMTVIKREYLERVRSKWFIIGTLFGPIFLMGMMVLPGLMTVNTMRKAQITDFQILDASGSSLGNRIAVTLRDRAMNDEARKALGDQAPALTETKVLAISMADLTAAESTATKAVMTKS